MWVQGIQQRQGGKLRASIEQPLQEQGHGRQGSRGRHCGAQRSAGERRITIQLRRIVSLQAIEVRGSPRTFSFSLQSRPVGASPDLSTAFLAEWLLPTTGSFWNASPRVFSVETQWLSTFRSYGVIGTS